MKCFVHQNTDAVGVCSSCGRGVCKVCAIKLRGKVYCKEDAVRLFDVRKGSIKGQANEGPTRGPIISVGAIFSYILGGVAIILSFVVIFDGILSGNGSSPLLSLFTFNLNVLGPKIQQYQGGELVTIGLALLIFGSIGIAAGYFFFRPTKAGGVLALAFGLIGLVAGFQLLAISVPSLVVYPWLVFSGLIIAMSLLGVTQMIRRGKDDRSK